MQTFMRKHRKLLLVIIILTIGIPMLFFGLPAFWHGAQGGAQGRVLATVGKVPIYEEQFMQALQQRAAAMAQGGTPASIEELDQAGVAGEILQQLIDQALFTHEIEQRKFSINEDFADERLREDSMFLNSEGQFDIETYNDWVRTMSDHKVNWNEIRRSVQENVARQVFVNTLSAPAGRVLDSQIEEELRDSSTKIRMRYAAVAPPVDVTEEELRTYFEENLDQFRGVPQRVAAYAAISLRPEVPEIAADLIRQAREGADFAALAEEHSAAQTGDGGALDWLGAEAQELEHRAPVFELAVGEVSDPVPGPGGYFIYKVEEERQNEETAAREVFARQIFLQALLSEEQREARNAQAQAVLASAQESGDLAAAAQEAGLELRQSAPFDMASELAEIPREDFRPFVLGLGNVEEGAFAPVISGLANLYVAQVTEVREGAAPAFEDAQEQVRERVIAQKKMSPEYQAEAQAFHERVKAAANSLEEIAAKFPELNLEIKESSEFSKRDFLFQDELYLSTPEIYAAIAHGEPGKLSGPYMDFRGEGYFVELSQVIPPTEEQMAAWPAERESLRERFMMMAERDLLEDYQLDMRQRLMLEVPISINQERLAVILRRDLAPGLEEITPETESPADTTPETVEG